MQEATVVGSSNRTYGKHSLLRKLIGRETGIITYAKPDFLSGDYTVLDLCAGNGIATDFSFTSSPEIIRYYTKNMLKTNVFLYEKDVYTFYELQKRYPDISYHQNAYELTELPIKVHDRSSVFIHCDPNLITDWALNEKLLQNSPDFTTMLITLGCNVGGLKRLPIERRQQWFDKVDMVLSYLPKWHDALLIALLGDKAQWAYLLTGPRKWHNDGSYKKDAKKSFNYWKHGIETVQYRTDEKAFSDLIRKLFLTKAEVNNAR